MVKERSKTAKWVIAAGIPAAFIVLYLIFSSKVTLADLGVRYFSRPIRDALGTLCTLVPFSVMELEYVLLGVFIIVFAVRTVILAVKSERRLRFLAKRLSILIIVALYILAGYLSLWGIDYKSSSFSDKENFYADGVELEDLYSAARYFVENTVALADTVQRDGEGHFDEDIDAYFALSVNVYDNLEKEFPSLEAETRIPKKMVFSEIMSRTGFTGVYFPYTGESNINVKNSAAFIPFTVAHELAHQRGVYSEQECNFLGVAACLSSDIPVYRYSGFIAGSVYLMNALYKASPELWQELRGEFSGNMLVDWNDNNAYWASMHSQVTDVSEKVYDTYLRVNGQEMGIQSYGACVDHMVAYYVLGGF